MSNIALTDWLTFAPAGEIRRQRAYIDLPAFSYAAVGSVGDPSVIVAQFNFSASRNFYLLTRPTKPAGVNYGLCIRYRVGETVYRYKLWEDPLFVLSTATPLYNKQLIKKNFVLEVWNFATVAPVQTTSVRMLSSVRSVPTDYRAIADYALAVGAEFTALANTNVAPTTFTQDNLVGDYDANLVEVDGSNNVQTLYDSSAGGRDLSQATAGFRPAYSLYAPPTPALPYPTVLYNGVDQYNSWVGSGISSANGWSVYMVGCLKGFVADQHLFTMGPGGLSIKTGTTTPDLRARCNLFVSAEQINSVPINEVKLIEGFFNDSRVYLFGDSLLPGINNGLTTGSDEAHGQGVRPSQTAWNLGGNGTLHSQLQFAKMLIYNKLHSEAERIPIRQFLENAYSIATITLPLTMNSGGPWLDNI